MSEGAADIDPRIIAAGLTLYVAMVQALKGFFDILHGQRATFFEYDGKKITYVDSPILRAIKWFNIERLIAVISFYRLLASTENKRCQHDTA